MERNYYMVRAMFLSENEFESLFDKGVVAVGWKEFDFTSYLNSSEQTLLDEVKKYYYQNTSPQTTGKKLNEIRRFLNIKKGDVIIAPYYSYIRIAIAGETFGFSKDCELANQLNVKYISNKEGLLTIPRDELSEAFQRRLRVRGSTVSDLSEFCEEIEKIMKYEKYSFYDEIKDKQINNANEFKKELLNRIQTGNTHLKTGGIGLETLVKELFECEGYTARVCGKNVIKGFGDVDVEAIKTDKFSEIKIITQIKHHIGTSGDWGITQLELAKEKYDNNIIPIFVTSAVPSEEAKTHAENAGIGIIDGNELVEWIYENIPKLCPQTLIDLGISTLPHII